MRVLTGVLGASIGALVVFLLIGVLFEILIATTGRFVVPRGFGWVVAIVIGGILGWNLGIKYLLPVVRRIRPPSLDMRQNFLKTRLGRAAVVISLLYPIGFIVYMNLEEPFGWRMSAQDWAVMWAWFFGIPVALLTIVLVVRWVVGGEK